MHDIVMIDDVITVLRPLHIDLGAVSSMRDSLLETADRILICKIPACPVSDQGYVDVCHNRAGKNIQQEKSADKQRRPFCKIGQIAEEKIFPVFPDTSLG